MKEKKMDKERIKALLDRKELLYEQYRKAEDEYHSALLEDFADYKGKYIVIDDNKWMYVDNFFTDTRDRYTELIINGKGFEYEISEYDDDCYFSSEMLMQETVRLDKYSSVSIEDQLNKHIKVVEKNDFLKEYHKALKAYEKRWFEE